MKWAVVFWVCVSAMGCSLLFAPADQAGENTTRDAAVADDGAIIGESCGSVTCPSNGFCVTTGTGKFCQCRSGFEGPDCANINDCTFFSCAHDGVCVDDVESYTCDCTGNWMGTRCDEEICASTTFTFSSVLMGCQPSPLQADDVTISAASGALCVPFTSLGIGDGFVNGSESLTLTFPAPLFVEVYSPTAQGAGETHVIGTRNGVQVYDATWTSSGTFAPWKQTEGGTLDTLTMTAQNNGGRSLQSIQFWSDCQADGG